MPASKPSSLKNSHQTKEEKADEQAAESAMTPDTPIPSKAPTLLNKHKYATDLWKRLISLYAEVDATIVTAFDTDLLAKYCLLEEECLWLEGKRAEVDKNAVKLDQRLAKMTLKGEDLKIYYQLMEQYNALNARVQGLDARLDGKRKLVHSLAQSLYLTPRSRAGVSPTRKDKPKEDGFGDEFD